MEHVFRDKRFENVELEVAIHTADGNRDLVAHNLGAEHGQSLALRGIDLTRHDT